MKKSDTLLSKFWQLCEERKVRWSIHYEDGARGAPELSIRLRPTGGGPEIAISDCEPDERFTVDEVLSLLLEDAIDQLCEPPQDA